MNAVTVTAEQLAQALRLAHQARRGLLPDLEETVRAFARGKRLSGRSVGETLIEVKALVTAHTGLDELVYMPKVVGWTVAGFFEGSNRPE
jgi:hypothetical protein